MACATDAAIPERSAEKSSRAADNQARFEPVVAGILPPLDAFSEQVAHPSSHLHAGLVDSRESEGPRDEVRELLYFTRE